MCTSPKFYKIYIIKGYTQKKTTKLQDLNR